MRCLLLVMPVGAGMMRLLLVVPVGAGMRCMCTVVDTSGAGE